MHVILWPFLDGKNYAFEKIHTIALLIIFRLVYFSIKNRLLHGHTFDINRLIYYIRSNSLLDLARLILMSRRTEHIITLSIE